MTAKTPPSEILTTIKVVKGLEEVVGKHDLVLEKLLDRVEQMEARIKVLETGAGGPRAGD